MGMIGFALALGFGLLIRVDEVPTIQSLEDSGQLCTPKIPDLADNIRFLLAGTKYEEKWTLNEQARNDAVNFYFFCPTSNGVSRNLQLYTNNCAYAGRPNLVVCDVRFLTGFVVSNGIAGEFSTLPSERARQLHNAQRDTLLWVLGHEIGHILANHNPAHFQANRLDDLITASSLNQKNELLADAWFVQHLRQDRNKQGSVEVTLSQLLYAQVRRKIGSANLYLGTGVPLPNQTVEYAKSGDHPEFVFRATRMLSLSYDRPETIQFKNQVDDFARALR
jgi:hypothetical protein